MVGRHVGPRGCVDGAATGADREGCALVGGAGDGRRKDVTRTLIDVRRGRVINGDGDQSRVGGHLHGCVRVGGHVHGCVRVGAGASFCVDAVSGFGADGRIHLPIGARFGIGVRFGLGICVGARWRVLICVGASF